MDWLVIILDQGDRNEGVPPEILCTRRQDDLESVFESQLKAVCDLHFC
jgi:hypothetical protein